MIEPKYDVSSLPPGGWVISAPEDNAPAVAICGGCGRRELHPNPPRPPCISLCCFARVTWELAP